MKFKSFAALVVACCVLSFAPVSFGAGDEKASKSQGGNPAAFFAKIQHEFSPVLEGASVTHDFVIQNKGRGPLKVKKVTTG